MTSKPIETVNENAATTFQIHALISLLKPVIAQGTQKMLKNLKTLRGHSKTTWTIAGG